LQPFHFLIVSFKGILKDEETVRSMSRTGNRKELLYGPLFYGIIFVLSASIYWGDSPLGITALMVCNPILILILKQLVALFG
jgi:phytol kinase